MAETVTDVLSVRRIVSLLDISTLKQEPTSLTLLESAIERTNADITTLLGNIFRITLSINQKAIPVIVALL